MPLARTMLSSSQRCSSKRFICGSPRLSMIGCGMRSMKSSLAFVRSNAGSLGESRSGIDSPMLPAIAATRDTLRSGAATGDAHAGPDHQSPLDRRRRVRLLPGAARGRRQGAGGGAGLRRARRRCRHPRNIADEFAAHGFIAAAPDLFWRTVPGRSATTTSAPRSARSRGSRRSRPASATWWTR